MRIRAHCRAAMYLRKSRADLEAELSGAGNTLARHRQTLTSLAGRLQLEIGAVYEEIVSGDTIADRPQMQRLLADVEDGCWDAVLVMEIERLARGDPIDQGVVARAFRCSSTCIVTPSKIYDPADEFDEEFLEFGLFMSRREYKTIRRRLSAGVMASRREGKYTGSAPPYGYERRKLAGEKGFTLTPDPLTAPIVRQIYDWFVRDRLPVLQISRRLNEMGLRRPRGGPWYAKAVADILQNPHYAGYTTSARRPVQQTVRDGAPCRIRPRSRSPELYDGRHEPLIPRGDWQAAQQRIRHRETPPVPRGSAQTNAFCGLLFCAACGARMQRGQYGAASTRSPYLFCPNRGCPTVSSSYDKVEALVLAVLRQWELPLAPQASSSTGAAALAALRGRLDEIARRRARVTELVETGVYSTEHYRARWQALDRAQAETEQAVQRLAHRKEGAADGPSIRTAAELYQLLSPHGRCSLLHTLFERIEYRKTRRASGRSAGDLELTAQLRLPFSGTGV